MDLSRMAAAAVQAALEQEQPDEKPRRRGITGMRAVAAGAVLAVAARAAVRKLPKSALMPAIGGLGGTVRDRVTDKLTDSGWLPGDDDDEDLEDRLPDDEDLDDRLPDDEDLEARFDDEDEDYDEDYDEDEPEAFEDDEDEPEDEGDDGWDDEEPEDDEPQAGGDEDEPSDDAEEDFEDEEDAGDEPEAVADEDEDVEETADEDEDEDLAEKPAAADDEDFDENAGTDDEEDDDRESDRGRRAPAIDVGPGGGNGHPRAAEGEDVLALLSARRKAPVMSRRGRRRAPVDPAARPPEPPEDEGGDRAGKRSTRKGKAKAGGS